jgi:Chromo (CHRromatin Organisation MOdifier) domain
MHADMAQKFFQDLRGQLQYCNTEWLVKWKGLGYEHVTWEHGSLNLLHSSEAKRLKQEYHHRQVDAARRANFASEHNKVTIRD